jgi:hypothetical protein
MQSIRQLSGVSLLFGGAVVSDWGTVTLAPNCIPKEAHISPSCDMGDYKHPTTKHFSPSDPRPLRNTKMTLDWESVRMDVHKLYVLDGESLRSVQEILLRKRKFEAS